MQRAATWLGGKLSAVAGRTFAYVQGGTTLNITATPVLRHYQVYEEGEVSSAMVPVWEFYVAASAMTVTPHPGDTLTETLNGNTIVYEVQPVGNETCFEPMDTAGIMLRIRTKIIE
jgi:hypothetical protein